jgi:hypothetical protein
MTPPPADIAIIGGGAAGLSAAIFAAEAARGQYRIVVLDSAKKLGAKILVSGGGRCNVTHDLVRPEDFHGSQVVVRNILRTFDEKATVQWFESLGVPLKREGTGKLFPVSDNARTVVTALLRRCDELGVTILTQHKALDLLPQRDAPWTVVHSQGTLAARRVILATGGRSLPKSGSDGHGWEIVRRLGHTVTATYPALVPLVLQGDFFHAALSGVSHPAELRSLVAGKQVDRRTGSLLWTHFGCSGPVVLDASRFVVMAKAQGQPVELLLNFLPGQRFEDADRWLIDAAAAGPRRSIAGTLADRLPHSVAEVLCGHVNLPPQQLLAEFKKADRRRLVHALVSLPLPVVGDRGWNVAEVTAGGVPLHEVDHRSMHSRKSPGMYLIGEMLDCDGRIGGFNFQWAWSTGHLAGPAAVRSLGEGG